MKVAIVCGMSDDKARAEILPIACLPEIEEIFLIRRDPLTLPKVTTYVPPTVFQSFLFLAELYRIFSLFYIGLTKKPDVYIGIYFILHGVYAWLAGKLFGRPVIQYLIGTDRPKVESSKLFIKIVNDSQYVGVRGNVSENNLVNLGIQRKKVFVPTGVNVLDFGLFKPSSEQKEFDIIYVGRIDRNKQVLKIIQAVRLVAYTHPDLKVALLGEGPEQSNLEKMVGELGLERIVTFLGNKPYADIPKYLTASRIFVMASDFEGLPVAMLEALSCGLPVVVPHVGDISDVALHGVNAIIVDPPTYEGFANALSALLEDPYLYSKLADGALASRNQFLHDYSFERSMEIWHSVLGEKQEAIRIPVEDERKERKRPTK